MQQPHKVVIQVQPKFGVVHADFADGTPFDGRIRPLVHRLEHDSLTLADVRVEDLDGSFDIEHLSRQARLVVDILLSSHMPDPGFTGGHKSR